MKKQFLSAITALLILMTMLVPVSASDARSEYGYAENDVYCRSCADADKSGKVDVNDARKILRASIKLIEVSGEDFGSFDADANGIIDVNDARIALRLSVGLASTPKHIKSRLVVLEEATCSKSGKGASLCSFCGKLFNVSKIPSPGHVKTRILVKQATCTETGLYEYRCKFCSRVMESMIIDKLPHDWEGAVTCIYEKKVLSTCKTCGTTDMVWAKRIGSHTYKNQIVKQPSCTEDGLKICKCTVCGDVKSEETLRNLGGHRKASSWRTLCTVSCQSDGEKVLDCTRCGQIIDRVITPRLEHRRKENSYVIDAAATCREAGSAHYTCSTCMQFVYITIPKPEHAVVAGSLSVEQTATCQNEGSRSFDCENCGHITETIPKLPHRPSSWTETVQATCVQRGSEEKLCLDCGEVVEARPIPIDSTCHDYIKISETPKTCTVNGSTDYECTRCGNTYSTTTAATGHIKEKVPELFEEHPDLGYDIYAYRCTVCNAIVEKQRVARL